MRIKENYKLQSVTDHYEFYCLPNSYAAQNLGKIAEIQEKCYKTITTELNIYPDFKIKYFLTGTPQETGELYGDNEPCNGFARLPDEIYAVYSEQVKCIGMHEDVHIISYSVKKPKSVFIGEGLAMYFDKKWQGKDNVDCCREILNNCSIDIFSLLDNDIFFAYSENITYPLAGGFTAFLIKQLAIKSYLENVFYNDNIISYLTVLFKDNSNLIKIFKEWVEVSQK